ncbi:DNA-binding domain-containing protein [Dyella jiangningensis]|uniref:Putative DNA-binding domain-containing protein n=1 Tax=Dyella jiangningensis TaxID=1379159 RepID=A0A328P5U0_9GAMM|nr:DNA-binding domain-containing protein [Dyella jiangningensis]RAO77637.1 hypothetical protein CA260_07160 [Dyella jiangningensis]
MKLAELQRDFRQWLVTSSAAVEQHLDAGAAHGLTVYQNNYRVQLVGCLEASYPLLLARMGADAFRQLAVAHIDDHPPHAWTLDAYGADFGDTLRERFPDHPDLHELAWIEWALSEAFVATDTALMPPSTLAQVDWDNARLALNASLRERPATTNAYAVWSAWQDGVEAPDGAMLDVPAGLIAWRRGFSCQLKPIDAIEFAAISSLCDDDRFASLCESLVDHLGEEAGIAKAGTLLAEWIAAGIVVEIHGDEGGETLDIDHATSPAAM